MVAILWLENQKGADPLIYYTTILYANDALNGEKKLILYNVLITMRGTFTQRLPCVIFEHLQSKISGPANVGGYINGLFESHYIS